MSKSQTLGLGHRRCKSNRRQGSRGTVVLRLLLGKSYVPHLCHLAIKRVDGILLWFEINHHQLALLQKGFPPPVSGSELLSNLSYELTTRARRAWPAETPRKSGYSQFPSLSHVQLNAMEHKSHVASGNVCFQLTHTTALFTNAESPRTGDAWQDETVSLSSLGVLCEKSCASMQSYSVQAFTVEAKLLHPGSGGLSGAVQRFRRQHQEAPGPLSWHKKGVQVETKSNNMKRPSPTH
ncbi:hypothetical protein QBC37DRAFT_5721 [Rhypophila decipiens]|uniref:Uncharacterized protein n=1 Tax=Rhypophila decipiens TaxID=261697 RepID=A0AAN7BDT5_9PEZI|nr:hypothetical protein QBC37DRAFT_5721 [Rhypophila decipiens]